MTSVPWRLVSKRDEVFSQRKVRPNYLGTWTNCHQHPQVTIKNCLQHASKMMIFIWRMYVPASHTMVKGHLHPLLPEDTLDGDDYDGSDDYHHLVVDRYASVHCHNHLWWKTLATCWHWRPMARRSCEVCVWASFHGWWIEFLVCVGCCLCWLLLCYYY